MKVMSLRTYRVAFVWFSGEEGNRDMLVGIDYVHGAAHYKTGVWGRHRGFL